MELLLSCEKIDLEKGLNIGLFDDTIEHENTSIAAENFLLNKFVGVDPSVVRAMKRMVLDQDPEQETEARIFAPLWGGPANKAALQKNIKHR